MRRYRPTFKPRSLRRYEKRNKTRLVWSIIISVSLLFVVFQWVFPVFIGQLSTVNKIVNPAVKQEAPEKIKLAPPVLNIPIEATNSGTIKIQGYAAANTKVRIYLDDNLVSETLSNNAGNFNSELFELSLGTNNIYGKTVATDGLESLPSKKIQITYSNEKPKLDLQEPEDRKEVKGGDKKIRVSGLTDPENEVTVNDLRVIVGGDGKFSLEINLNEGENIINIIATNEVGNKSTKELRVTYTP